MARKSLAGQSGYMPVEMYLKKYETSDYPEDPEQLYNHNRAALVDTTCDKPFLESDQKRTSHYDAITVRTHGARSQYLPDLPDGTFLHFDALDKDPRSIMDGPDKRIMIDHSRMRGKLINFKNDNCHTVHESGMAPSEVIEMKKRDLPRLRDAYKNFEESTTSWMFGGTGAYDRLASKPLTEKYDVSSELPRPDDPALRPRNNYIIDADCLPIGFHSVGSQRIKIAQYAPVRMGVVPTEQDWYKARVAADTTRQKFAMYENRPISQADALAIVDLMKQKKSNHDLVRNAAKWADITTAKNNSGVADYGDQFNNQSDVSQTVKRSVQDSENKIVFIPTMAKTNDKSDYAIRVASLLQNMNKKVMTTDKIRDLREAVERSFVSKDIGIQMENKAVVLPDVIDHFTSEVKINGKDVKVANYKAMELKDISQIRKDVDARVRQQRFDDRANNVLVGYEVGTQGWNSEGDQREGMTHGSGAVHRNGGIMGDKDKTRFAKETEVDDRMLD
jgi:hypothetical protein